MEVVRPGVISGELAKPSPGTCCVCKCEFLFRRVDVRPELRRGLGGPYEEYYVNCPTCGVQINVPSSYH